MGREITLRETPRRIISLVPSQTELLYDLGLEDNVVGITKFCVHPVEWFQTKPRVGGTKKLNFEAIEQLQPDLIIGNKEENEQSDIDRLMQDYNVWMSDIHTLDEAHEMIMAVGEITGTADKALHINQGIREQFMKLEQHKLACEGKRAAYLIWTEPYMAAGHNTFIDHLIELTGMVNVFSIDKFPELNAEFGSLHRYPEISAELLQQQAPELLLLSSEPFPFKQKHIPHFQELLPDTEIVLVDGEIFSWPASRLLQAPEYFTSLFK